jgi:Zn-finger nucleic acid-binding protein
LYEQAKSWPAPHLVVLCPKCHELMKAMLVLADGTRPMNVCSKCEACWLEKGDLDLALIHARQMEEGGKELTEDQRERVAVAELHIRESARAESDDSFFGDVDDQEPTMFVLTGARFCVLLPLRILKQMYAFFAASGPDQRRAALGKLIAAVIFAALLAFVVWGELRR